MIWSTARVSLIRGRWDRLLAFVVAILVATAATSSAQSATGGLRGVVADSSGAVLAGVTVEAESPARIGGPAVEVTNEQGLYRFEGLPIGIYTVTFSLQGFTTVKREGVRIEVSRTIEVPAELAIGNLSESLTVEASSPVVDTIHSTATTSFNRELLQNTPSLRTSWFDTVMFAPAVKANQVSGNSASFNIYGTTSNQNSYQVNGVEVSSPSGTVWDFANPDYFEEVSVQGVGASAEYSGFQGGVVNIVTRGGSNTFRGNGSYFFTDNKLVSSNGFPDASRPYPYYIDYVRDFNASLGGPIKKDRVWFYATTPVLRRRGSNIGVDPQFAARTRAFRPYTKITSRLSNRDSVDFSYNDNIFYSPNAATVTRPLVASTVENGNNPVITASWKRQMSNVTLFELKGGGIYIRDRLDPISGDFSTPGRSDSGTGLDSVNATTTTRWHMNRTSVDASVTRFVNSFLGGSHDLKTGFQFFDALQITNVARFGGVSYNDLNGAPDQATFRAPTSVGGRARGTGFFVQDNFTATSRLTLNLGFRFDHTTGSIPDMDAYDTQAKNPTGDVYPGLGTVVTFNNPAPRFGFTYKLDSSGKTVAKGSWGQYYGRLPVSLFENLGNGNVTTSTYRFSPATGQYSTLLSTTDPRANIALDPNLKNQYTNQFFLGLEREVMPNFSIDTSFIYKTDKNMIGVIDTGSVFAPTTVTDTFEGRTQTLTVFNRTSPASSARNTTMNPEGWEQVYRSFIVQGNKRLTSRWSLLTSYQWQRGTSVLAGQNFTTAQNPNTLINASGRIRTDSTHAFKAAALFVLPYEIRLGVRESIESGRPIFRQIVVRGLSQGNVNVFAEPAASYLLPRLNDLQIRLDKDFAFAGSRRIRLSVDFFNLFNVSTPTDVQTTSGQGVPFLTTTGIFLPRRAQVGLRVDF